MRGFGSGCCQVFLGHVAASVDRLGPGGAHSLSFFWQPFLEDPIGAVQVARGWPDSGSGRHLIYGMVVPFPNRDRAPWTWGCVRSLAGSGSDSPWCIAE